MKMQHFRKKNLFVKNYFLFPKLFRTFLIINVQEDLTNNKSALDFCGGGVDEDEKKTKFFLQK